LLFGEGVEGFKRVVFRIHIHLYSKFFIRMQM
jgi:hypothetical protein